VDFAAHPGQNFRDTERDCGVGVMAARVFDARDDRFVGDVNGFVYGQRIHVRAESDDRAGLCALEDRDNAVVGDVSFDVVESESAQFICDEARSAFFAIGKLRVHVKVTTDLDQSWTESGGGAGDSGGLVISD
jgi:hypothetical protein